MIFLLSKELWQTVRHCARKAEMNSDLWFWTGGDFGGDIRLRSMDGDTTLATLIGEAARVTRGPVSIIAASPELSKPFEHVIDCLIRYPGELRLSLMLTSAFDGIQVEECRQFLQENSHMQRRVSTFFLAGRMDTELAPLAQPEVSEQYTSFLRLLLQGGESLADRMGLFRDPRGELVDESEDVQLDRLSSYGSQGMVSVLGVRSWIPRKEKIMNLTESLLSKLVGEEEKRAAIGSRIRSAGPDVVINSALQLGAEEEPLDLEHFAEEIPEAPASPLESWKVPVSRGRARKERRHLQRAVQRDFSNYTEALKTALNKITDTIYNQSFASFSAAAATYREDLLKGVDLGNLSLFVRNYFPAFESHGETPLAGPEEEAKGWLPHESLDCFSHVYDTLEDGLDQLPTTRVWQASVLVGLAFLVPAWNFQSAELWVPLGLVAAGFLSPCMVWVYRTVRLWKLRRELVAASDETFGNLRKAFEDEVRWVLQKTRVQLERDIRKDATSFGRRLWHEFEALPWLAAVGEIERDGIQEDIRQLRSALLGIGVDENRLDRLPILLEVLARRIVEKAGREDMGEDTDPSEPTPAEVVEEWIDELVGTAVLPLNRAASLKDEILETAGAWRLPALMAPLTDAEVHRGFRKVVVLPDTDLIYQRLRDSLPGVSGNPVVHLDVWSGGVPGVAICSVMTGLTESILDYQVKTSGNGVFSDGR